MGATALLLSKGARGIDIASIAHYADECGSRRPYFGHMDTSNTVMITTGSFPGIMTSGFMGDMYDVFLLTPACVLLL